MQITDLFPAYKKAVSNFSNINERNNLLIRDFGSERVYYAPFDYVNPQAKLFIVGITPGEFQMKNMLLEAKRLIEAGFTDEEVIRRCKTVGSFSGPMRKNLVEMMDYVGLAKYLGISTTAELFDRHADLVNLTSCIRYPTFAVKNGKESNFNRTIRPSSALFKFAAPLTLEEIQQAPNALILPLGPKVSSYLQKVLEKAHLSDRLLPELPHPSGANAERIAYFLGRKDKADLSGKTNPDKLDAIKAEFHRILSAG